MLIDEVVDEKDRDFDFLKDVGLKDVRLFWYSDSNPQVLGGFYLLSGNRLYINREFVSFKDDDSWSEQASRILMVFPTIIHELCHYWQWKRFKLGYLFMQLPIVREFAIERKANRISDKLYDKVGGLVGSREGIAVLKKSYGFPKECFDQSEIDALTKRGISVPA